jgi:hypothetical protein
LLTERKHEFNGDWKRVAWALFATATTPAFHFFGILAQLTQAVKPTLVALCMSSFILHTTAGDCKHSAIGAKNVFFLTANLFSYYY